MNEDIRLSLSFWDHHKTIRLKKCLGYEGIEALQRLWLYAAEHRPNGHLVNMDDEDVALAAHWNGETNDLIKVLADPKYPWLDRNGDHYYLHNWHKRNAYASFSEKRSEQARKASQKRWEKRYKNQDDNAQSNTDNNADSCKEQCDEQQGAYPPSPTPSPIPTPIPSPTPYSNGVEKIKFDFTKGIFLNITETDIDDWQKAYPDVDIKNEILRAAQWCKRNKKKVQGRDDLGKTLVNWFSRKQDKKDELKGKKKKKPIQKNKERTGLAAAQRWEIEKKHEKEVNEYRQELKDSGKHSDMTIKHMVDEFIKGLFSE